MKKRVLAFVAAICLGLSTGSVVMAETASVQPRAQQCGSCGSMSLHTTTTYQDWSPYRAVTCKKNPIFKDKLRERQVNTTYKCGNCGYSTVVSSIESQVICNH